MLEYLHCPLQGAAFSRHLVTDIIEKDTRYWLADGKLYFQDSGNSQVREWPFPSRIRMLGFGLNPGWTGFLLGADGKEYYCIPNHEGLSVKLEEYLF